MTLFEGLRAYRHEATPLDYNFGFFLIFATALALTTPLTPGWRLVRTGLFGPAIVVGWIFLAWIPYIRNDSEQWGVTLLMSEFEGTAPTLRREQALISRQPHTPCVRWSCSFSFQPKRTSIGLEP